MYSILARQNTMRHGVSQGKLKNFSSLVDWLQDGRGGRLVQLQLMVHLVRGASAIIEPVSQHILEDHALILGLQLIAHDPV